MLPQLDVSSGDDRLEQCVGSREGSSPGPLANRGVNADVSLEVQTNSTLRNAGTGFFIVYIATFNEWHEGTSFEPMKDRAALLPQELSVGYHNPADGRYRLDYLKPRLEHIIRG
jgi:hypothetical protein